MTVPIGWTRSSAPNPDLICFSHLRWDFVYQRPQHLMTRFRKERRVFYVEDTIFGDHEPHLSQHETPQGIHRVIPHLPHGLDQAQRSATLSRLFDALLHERSVTRYGLWYYTPMPIHYTRHLTPLVTVYDCMDELALFKFAPPPLRERERELFERADLVFTGGASLYEAKRHQHADVHLFPSSVDVDHFSRARERLPEPPDQQSARRPRLGFFGVIDERMDLALLAGIAEARPDWSLVMIGPVVKIDPATLPRRANIHYLGMKPYHALPGYISSWDVAILPFARNDATRFISPTKTPEYLAAGRPVVSTSIQDVVDPYQRLGLARIADTPAAFIRATEEALAEDSRARGEVADEFLSRTSWDDTWRRMSDLMEGAVARRQGGRASC